MEQLNLFEEQEPVSEAQPQQPSEVPQLNTTCPYALKLQRLFRYEDGELYWKVKKGVHGRPGKIAGTVTRSGAKVVKINRKTFQVHRLIWIMFNGRDSLPPEKLVDHIRGVSLGNFLGNLRPATRSQNAINIDHSKRPNASRHGVGIQFYPNCRRRWRAFISGNGKRVSKTFETKQEAIDWRNRMVKELHGEFARTNP